jgi:hypothetical protein
MSLGRVNEASVSPDLDLDAAFAHPTLPPPHHPRASVGWWRWVGPSFVIALFSVVAVDVVGNHPWGRFAAAAHELTAARVDAVVGRTSTAPNGVAHLDRMLRAFPGAVANACPRAEERAPLVVYSSVDTLFGDEPRAASLIPGALTVTRSVLRTSARRVAVLRTTALAEPRDVTPGSYEGTLVVFDAATSAPICGTVVHASSVPATSTSAAGHENFVAVVRSAVMQSGARIGVTLDL